MTNAQGGQRANPYMQRVGARVLEARAAAGWTQQQLADRVSLVRSSVANIENGRQGLDAIQLAQFARALGVTLDFLVRADDLPPEPEMPPVPHVVDIRAFYEVTCRTCAPGQPFDVARDRAQAAQSRKDHIAEMQERDAGERAPGGQPGDRTGESP